MMDLDDLQRLVTVLRSEALASQAGHIGWSIQRLPVRISVLEDAAVAELHRALRGLEPTVHALCEKAERHEHLDPNDVRDLRTLWRRFCTTLDHVTAHPGPDRLEPDALSVRYARVDVAAVFREACGVFAPLAEVRELAYEVEAPPQLVAELDRGKLELAIGNVLFNALKYAPQGGMVRCTVAVDEGPGDVVLFIEDSGPDRTPTDLDASSPRTQELDRSVAIVLPEVRLSPGLSRDVIALHGGTLYTVPTPGSHSLVEIRVPCRAPRGVAVVPKAPAAATWLASAAALAESELHAEAELDARPTVDDDRPLVLVIGSARSLNRAVTRCLEPDYTAASAFDGEAGLELARSLHPDLIVIDLALPKLDGEAVIQALRAQEDAHAAILVLTERRNESQILRLLDAGVHDILSKPVLLAELRARAARLIATKKARDLLGETIGQRDMDLVTLAGEMARTHHALERACAELLAARERAERLSNAKSNFLRVMSHELKTPVTAMKLQLSVLDRDPGVEHTEVLDRGLQRLARSTSRLLCLVDTVLEWSRVNDGRYRPEIASFDLPNLVRGATAELEDHALIRRLDLVVTVQPELRPHDNDPRLVRLVLLNLVGRAISVSNEGQLRIRVEPSPTGSRVCVRDLGPTLTEQQIGEVFHPFEDTSDFHRRNGAGSGLGVHALCDIARVIGGTIKVEPDAEPGNVFVFDVPASHPCATSGRRGAPSPNALHNPRR